MAKLNKEENQSNIAQFIGNNNKVEQNNYINPVTIDSNFLLDITKKQHKLYPYFFTGIDKLPNGKIGYKSIPASKEAEIKFPLSIQSNVTVIDEKYKGYTDLKKINTTFNLNLSQSLDYTKDDYDSINFLEKILLPKNTKQEKEVILKLDASQIEEKNIVELIDKDSGNVAEVRENIYVSLLKNNLHISKVAKIYTNYTIKNKKELLTDMKSCIEDGVLNIILVPKNDYINIETRYTI